MKCEFVPIEAIDLYDEFHQKDGDSFEVNVALDGNTTEYHKQGIELVKQILQSGEKVLPVLVLKNGDRYTMLDGFKRAMAHKELGYTNIEAFVAEEIDGRGLHPELKEMRACKGGQSGMPWTSEEEILYWRGGDGLRIERADGGFHVHWGVVGKYRLTLGEKDFRILAESFGKI